LPHLSSAACCIEFKSLNLNAGFDFWIKQKGLEAGPVSDPYHGKAEVHISSVIFLVGFHAKIWEAKRVPVPASPAFYLANCRSAQDLKTLGGIERVVKLTWL
jgi:hypothetical protein